MRTLNLILLIQAHPQMVLKLNIYNSDFSGIQTHDLCLVTGNHYLPKSAILRRRLPNEALNICLTIADRN